jgi:hypothetical protein
MKMIHNAQVARERALRSQTKLTAVSSGNMNDIDAVIYQDADEDKMMGALASVIFYFFS